MNAQNNDYSNIFSLNKRTAFIVGGEGLIGSEITEAISSYGAKTFVLDINDSIKNDDKNITKIYFDCAKVDTIEKNLSEIINKFGCPDIFINCSYPRTKDWSNNSFNKITLDSFQKNIDMHLNSYAWLARLIANYMIDYKKKGSIVQLGSIYGIVGQDLSIYNNTEMNENMSYSVIKGGLINLTRQMASYYGKHGIRINTICAGGVIDVEQNSDFNKQYSKRVPLGRLANSSEIASAALFLASDASNYITGSNLIVDGGWTAI